MTIPVWPPAGRYRVFDMKYSLSVNLILLTAVIFISTRAVDEGRPWARHAIDASSIGADGARMSDVNGDGRPDIATAWEEGGLIRIYLNPGPGKAAWPSVTVGRVGDPEDAVFADLDGDGAIDVVSCAEGATRGVFVHWAPRDKSKYLDSNSWVTRRIPAVDGRRWMFSLPIQVDGRNGTDLIVGGKDDGARIGWLESPADPRDLAGWVFHPLYDAGWIMSLIAADMDGDGDLDVLATDRKGEKRGVLWLERPADPSTAWPVHRIGSVGRDEVMFLDYADLDGDGRRDILVPTREGRLMLYRKVAGEWRLTDLPFPPLRAGKAVSIGDIDLDGTADIVLTTEQAARSPHVIWMSRKLSGDLKDWRESDISGQEGSKFDLCPLVDLDGDGDLDVITTEEVGQLGLIWYENPLSRPV